MLIFPKKKVRNFLFAILRVCIATHLLFGALLYLRQDAFLFLPPTARMEECADLTDAVIVQMDDTRAYYLALSSSTNVAIIYHGNGENACDSADLLHWLAQRGYNVLAVEYGGYAGDSANPTVELLLRDVENVEKWRKEKNFTRTVIIGRSIGTGFASYHARLSNPEKLILIAPFDKLSLVTATHFPIYPTSLMIKTEMDNITNAAFSKEVLVIHGTDDVVIPFTSGKSLYEQLPQKKSFVAIPNHAHNDVLNTKDSWSAIELFLR